jgi:zinc and cadmium transporter
LSVHDAKATNCAPGRTGRRPGRYNARLAAIARLVKRGLKIDPILISILLATTIAGVFSITAAAVFSFALLSKMVERMVSLSVGIMLSTSLLHALPEAFESNADPRSLFATLLGGLLAFFMLEKFAILRHSHHHEGDGHHHAHGHDKREAGKSGWMILVGDGMHNFTDGILIAA